MAVPFAAPLLLGPPMTRASRSDIISLELLLAMENNQLQTCLTDGASINNIAADTWHLEIPPGKAGNYRVAQLDNYGRFSRKDFPYNPPMTMQLQARASAENIPGTWGFGLWNDPFSLSSGLGGGARRFPALPNTAWFFFASAPNYLSLRDDLPANGNLAATFQSPVWPTALLALAAPALILMTIPGLARPLRRLARRFIQQSAISFPVRVTEWQTYRLEWQAEKVLFYLNGELLLESEITPTGPLGLVTWVDNQYASLPPNGKLAYGTLPNSEAAWIEIRALESG